MSAGRNEQRCCPERAPASQFGSGRSGPRRCGNPNGNTQPPPPLPPSSVTRRPPAAPRPAPRPPPHPTASPSSRHSSSPSSSQRQTHRFMVSLLTAETCAKLEDEDDRLQLLCPCVSVHSGSREHLRDLGPLLFMSVKWAQKPACVFTAAV
ncbi:hypothetical protein WMY93_023209 [Mugilogobius chulae]|uniref:Uncharacterized protein n=1 Tax=Mugilogobius chulae TaxID=88201 RepID=A0AAW0N563_9GOBI